MDYFSLLILLPSIGAIFVSHAMNTRVFHALSDEDQSKLRNEFKSIKTLTTIPLALLGAVFIIFQSSFEKNDFALYFLLPAGLVIAFRTYWNHRQLERLQLPDDYRRKYMLVQLIHLAAVVGIFYAIYTLM